jgi:hypothetical protein
MSGLHVTVIVICTLLLWAGCKSDNRVVEIYVLWYTYVHTRWVILLLQPGDRAKTNTKLDSTMLLAESLQVSGQLELAGPNRV